MGTKQFINQLNSAKAAASGLLAGGLFLVLSGMNCGFDLRPSAVKVVPMAVQALPDYLEAEIPRWYRASIHNHTVWNFEWMYDKHSEMTASELKDKKLYEDQQYTSTRNFELDGYRELQSLGKEDGVDIILTCEHNTIIQKHLLQKSDLPLEEVVAPLAEEAGFRIETILINTQEFTKTANIWGIGNNASGTNSNRIVVMKK
jgi:hypothetical protein